MANGDRLTIIYPAQAGEVAVFAARELARSLGEMLGAEAGVGAVSAPTPTPASAGPWLRVERGGRDSARPAPPAGAEAGGLGPARDGFALQREAVPCRGGVEQGALVIQGGSERALLHAAYYLLERLGAAFPVIGEPRLPRIGVNALDALDEVTIEPAFARRAFVSDIMTWHYENPARLAFHLEHDRTFIPWMSARGINAFSYIRHARDSRMKIDELTPVYHQRGIAAEYGGHVLQLLLPRGRFERHPEDFPAGDSGSRNRHGNLCVSSADAMAEVRAGAVRYARENPEGQMLHIWGADVWQGAWCRCGECAELSPQQQYMKVVNAIGEALALEGISGCPVAYLAYHDTLQPDPGLRPLANVHFEWAPRERCYSHAIDDNVCAVNPAYYESLRRYIELFDGRGHIFEYYADAILFGGFGVATPSVIARDLGAYRALGLESISCLTFGAYSTLAYPVNLEAFARGTRWADFDTGEAIEDTARQLHPQCGPAMAAAYLAIAEASSAILEHGGDVMRPKAGRGVAILGAARREELMARLDRACAAAEAIAASGDGLAAGQRGIWHYNRIAVSGIAAYLAALESGGSDRHRNGEAAIAKIVDAIGTLQAIQPALRGTWGTYDIEWIRPIWIEAMRRRLAEAQS